MAIGREHGAYRAAERGEAPPPPEPLWNQVRDLPGVDHHLNRAVKLILEAANSNANVRGHDAPNAWEYLKEHARTEQEHHDLMRVALYLAKQQTEYWGVADPSQERYCSTCRRVKPRSEFPEGDYNCKGCV